MSGPIATWLSVAAYPIAAKIRPKVTCLPRACHLGRLGLALALL